MTHGDRTAEWRQPVWIIPGPLVIWALHFMLSYITAAIGCGRIGGAGEPPRLLIAAYTAVALAAIGVIAAIGYRAHRQRGEDPPHDADSAADRHRFIGYAAWLIAGLSAIAVIYSAMAAALIPTCD
jgi:hypothetical protein